MDLAQCLSKKIRLLGAKGNTTQQVAQITAYAPETFARLRSHFDISDAAFTKSIFESGPYISFQSNSKGVARSGKPSNLSLGPLQFLIGRPHDFFNLVGGVFFFTRDGAYMIKTIKVCDVLGICDQNACLFPAHNGLSMKSRKTGEAQTFIRMLPKYYKHMRRNKRYSLLTRFCGMYTVNIRDATTRAGLNDEQQYTFVIMNSVFPSKASSFISQMYDLKGSTVGRECSDQEKRKKGPNAVLKDLDLAREIDLISSLQKRGVRSVSKGHGIQLGASTKSMLLAQLRKDVALLRDCRVMDYSLLVGIVNIDQGQIDAADLNALALSANEEKLFDLAWAKDNPGEMIVRVLTTPVRLMIAPPLFFTRRMWQVCRRAMSSVLTFPLPYFGASECGVNGGTLSVVHGYRSGKRAIYYLGLIDFLQPWTARKVAEKQLKGFLGYDTKAISCVDPDEYASRFLDFVEAHIA